MKKTTILILIIFITTGYTSQIPTGYYNNAANKTGYVLKTALKTIITNGHVNHSYGSLYTGYQSSDKDIYYENDNSVLDMYSENPNGTDPYFYTHGNRKCGNYNSEDDCYNREHLMPQSVFNKASPMKNDIHFVVPSDGYVNGQRSNLPFGEVGSASWTSMNGSKKGTNTTTGYSGVVFEPIDEFKGDIARCMLYFATRYESQVTGWTYNNVLNGTSNQVYTNWFLNVLLQWNKQDTVSQREIDRNNACYVYQGNRNPFIDHNNYVDSIWGLPNVISIPESVFSTLKVYPNPTLNQSITISNQKNINSVEVYTVLGKKVKEILQNNIEVKKLELVNLPKGILFVKIKSGVREVVKKVIVR